MTPQKSHLYDTITLPYPWRYYLSPRICVPFFAIGRSTSAALWHSFEYTSILTDACFWVAGSLWNHRRFHIPFNHLLHHLCVLSVVPLGRWKERLQLSCIASAIMLQVSATSVLLCFLGNNIRLLDLVL
ncbi:hypothetical protein BHE74_00021545 [Ensete ventricosum]|nr:hypothetical protein BHE74_00021545 [Ensete ventricosum]RZS17602.1 hypothetical protein BHM03_00049756 [Ensete ventricosum]